MEFFTIPGMKLKKMNVDFTHFGCEEFNNDVGFSILLHLGVLIAYQKQ